MFQELTMPSIPVSEKFTWEWYNECQWISMYHKKLQDKTLQLSVWEVPGSNINLQTGCLDWCSTFFFSPLPPSKCCGNT